MKNILLLLLFPVLAFSQCNCDEFADDCGINTLTDVNKTQLYALDSLVTFQKNITTGSIENTNAQFDGNRIVASENFYISDCKYISNYFVNVANLNNGNGITRRVLKIGDSLTDGILATSRTSDRFAADVMNINFVGTQDTPPELNEGYSGKTFNWFYTDAASPFVFGGVFDFAQYLTVNSITLSANDWVTFQLGTNDMFPGDNCDNDYNVAKTAFDAMVINIKAAVPGVRIGVATIHNTAIEDAAWINNYGNASYNQLFHDCAVNWNNRLIADYPVGANDIYIIPLHYAVDCANDYPVDGNGDQANAVHPAITGYYRIGDYYFNFLKYYQ